MDKTTRTTEWNGTSMRDGLEAGMFEVTLRTPLAPPVVSEQVRLNRDRTVTILVRRRHATASVRQRRAVPPRDVEVPGMWSASLVEARLRRAWQTFARMDAGGTVWPMQWRSCMPTPVRERWLDYPVGYVARVRAAKEEIDLALETYGWLLDEVLDLTSATNVVLAEAVALGLPWKETARELRRRPDCQTMSNHAAKARARRLVQAIAASWNAKGRKFDVSDIRMVESLHASNKSVIH